VRARDVGSGTVPIEHLGTPVEALTITFNPKSKSAATLDVEWENTRVRIPVERR
jgi:DNA mismatch repair protein MutH